MIKAYHLIYLMFFLSCSVNAQNFQQPILTLVPEKYVGGLENGLSLINYNLPLTIQNDSIKSVFSSIHNNNNEGTLFVTYQYEEENKDVSLFKFSHGMYDLHVNPLLITTANDLNLFDAHKRSGKIISIIYTENGVNKSSQLVIDQLGNNNVLEFLYYKEALSSFNRRKVESYLSIKSGISLGKGESYLNSNGDTIWDSNINSEHNHRVTAIGKDEIVGLNQKQSKNIENEFLSISLGKLKKRNDLNLGEQKDQSFLFWSDNDGAIIFNEDEIGNNVLEREWLMSPYDFESDDDIEILIDPSAMFNTDDFNPDNPQLWIAIDHVTRNGFSLENASVKRYDRFENGTFIFKIPQEIFKSRFYFTLMNNVSQTEDIIQTDDLLTNQISIYPVPVNSGEKFNLSFNLNKKSDPLVVISDASGRLVSEKQLKDIKENVFSYSLMIPGVYIMSVHINGNITSFKLLVQ
ncbi:T9SS type A sorting domain-containing protein [Nonlabens ulvanivorans]|uniref:T9SS type A sorting domain-containing protein n=1 Tax=Nonlabens ulvanivorans TaxID=906888 RepID=UPI0029439064|nr:T9SS type A sorting domain-containing protein [Nonlabens ulvanivorans]WOI22888.1 T9SS type A sorting domain-containing protein [Nonlabens ulvanivorans]